MSTTYSLRIRLRMRSPGALDPEALVNSLFTALDQRGVAEDVSEPGTDGSYAVWLAVTANDPSDAVAQSMTFLEFAQRESRPDGPLDEVVSIELMTAAETTAELPVMPTAI